MIFNEHPKYRDLKSYYFWAIGNNGKAMVGPIDATNTDQAKQQARHIFGTKFGEYPNELVQQ